MRELRKRAQIDVFGLGVELRSECYADELIEVFDQVGFIELAERRSLSRARELRVDVAVGARGITFAATLECFADRVRLHPVQARYRVLRMLKSLVGPGSEEDTNVAFPQLRLKPIAPKPAPPESAEPKVAEPQATVPKPAVPKPVAPKPVAPKPAVPKPVVLKPIVLKPGLPAHGVPKPSHTATTVVVEPVEERSLNEATDDSPRRRQRRIDVKSGERDRVVAELNRRCLDLAMQLVGPGSIAEGVTLLVEEQGDEVVIRMKPLEQRDILAAPDGRSSEHPEAREAEDPEWEWRFADASA